MARSSSFLVLCICLAAAAGLAAAANNTTATAPAKPAAKNATAAAGGPVVKPAVNVSSKGVPLPAPGLDEFKNASAVAAVADAGDAPAVCPLKDRDLAPADVDKAKSACDVVQLKGAPNTAGSDYCKQCGCKLDVLPYKSLQAKGVLGNASSDNGVTLDACAQWTFDHLTSTGVISNDTVAALKKCMPIDFVCSEYSQHLDTSLITGGTTDQMAALGRGMQDAVSSLTLPPPPPTISAAAGSRALPALALAAAFAAMLLH